MSNKKAHPKEEGMEGAPHMHYRSGAVVGVANANHMDEMGIAREEGECACIWIVSETGNKRAFNLDVESALAYADHLLKAAQAMQQKRAH